MGECWARCLGDCDDDISREHLVSKGLWTGTMLRVRGLPWCKDEPKEIGLSGFTSKILCGHHNSQLAVLDTAAISAFDAFREAAAISNKRKQRRLRRWKIARLEIEGFLLERWFLKPQSTLHTSGASVRRGLKRRRSQLHMAKSGILPPQVRQRTTQTRTISADRCVSVQSVAALNQ